LKILKKVRVVVLVKPVRPVSSTENLDYGILNVANQIDSKLEDSFLGILVDDCSKESERYAWSQEIGQREPLNTLRGWGKMNKPSKTASNPVKPKIITSSP
jgi:hypothetical protein